MLSARRAILVLCATILAHGQALSQSTAPEPSSRAAASQGAFCGGTAVEMTLRQLEEERRRLARDTQLMPSALPIFQRQCQVGDILNIPITEILVIGSLCDFDKSIVNTGRNILCVYAPVRGNR